MKLAALVFAVAAFMVIEWHGWGVVALLLGYSTAFAVSLATVPSKPLGSYEPFDPALDRTPLRPTTPPPPPPVRHSRGPLVLGSDGRLYCPLHVFPDQRGGLISAPVFGCVSCAQEASGEMQTE